MPNYISIDGQRYQMPSRLVATHLFFRAADCMERAQKDAEPKIFAWQGGAGPGQEPVYLAVLVTPSSAVSLVIDRDDSDELSQSWGDRVKDGEDYYAERNAAEIAREGAEQAASAS